VKKDDLSPDDIIIACVISHSYFTHFAYTLLCRVMGPTGSGKSTVSRSHTIPNDYFSLL
jgi:hypothetical protein